MASATAPPGSSSAPRLAPPRLAPPRLAPRRLALPFSAHSRIVATSNSQSVEPENLCLMVIISISLLGAPSPPNNRGYVSRAALIFARTHAAPPRRLHFAHSSSVILTGRAFIDSPSLAIGFRPCPRPAPPRQRRLSEHHVFHRQIYGTRRTDHRKFQGFL